MPSSTRLPYKGQQRSLVLALDFGTTFSGVSYAILEPREVPQIRSVNGFKGQEDQSSSTKVPSVLLYDRSGTLRARGAEINDPEISFNATEEEWYRVEWLKILFRPREQALDQALLDAPEAKLPPGKTPVKVLGDFLEYLQQAARSYIEVTHVDGSALWKEAENTMVYVLSHPNGWGGSQQSKMREAAILGGLIPDTDEGRSRIRFVSEGEASLHWCVESGLAATALQVSSKIIVADAGGGTIDVSSFKVTHTDPLQLDETHPADCRLAGSIFVTQAFRSAVEESLADSAYGDAETITRLVDEFDRKTKRLFREPSKQCFIPFGTPRDHDPVNRIRSGQYVMRGDEVSEFFKPSCKAVADAIRQQTTPGGTTTVFLVGGFAASPWLLSEVQRQLLDCQVVVKRAESHTAKAVAEGAVGFYLDHYITTRVAKLTYGVFSYPQFDASNVEHVRRKDSLYEDVSGKSYVAGGFSTLVSKGTAVRETTQHRQPFIHELSSKSSWNCNFNLICYRGSKSSISWVDEDPGKFGRLCVFKATIPASCCRPGIGVTGTNYWIVDFSAVVTFGTTEFTCHVEWTERGETQRGPATIVWDEG